MGERFRVLFYKKFNIKFEDVVEYWGVCENVFIYSSMWVSFGYG